MSIIYRLARSTAARNSFIRPRNFHSSSTLRADEKEGFFQGLSNKLTNKVEERKENQADEQFAKTLKFMVERKTLTMDDFYLHLKSGFEELENSWRGKISERLQKEELALAREQTNIFAVMTKPERMRPDLKIKRPQKIRIAKEAGVSIEKVNDSIRQYEESAMFHAWIQRRHKLGLVLPANAAQSQKMFQLDKTGIKSRKVNKMMKMNRRPHAR